MAVNKQVKIQTNAKGVLIEKPRAHKHAHQLNNGKQTNKRGEKR